MTDAVAALYIDPRGPYPGLVRETFDVSRGAGAYVGPAPVVAHPPCGPWGRYHQRCHQDASTGPEAVALVRKWGGVLEHPEFSKLWRACGMPAPGELPDAWGGWTLRIEQSAFGHIAPKPTWLYIVGATRIPKLPPSVPDPGGRIELLAKTKRHLTPPALAQWLVELASSVGPR